MTAARAITAIQIESSTTPGVFYTVTADGCTCPGWRFGRRCKHVTAYQAAQLATERPELSAADAVRAVEARRRTPATATIVRGGKAWLCEFEDETGFYRPVREVSP